MCPGTNPILIMYYPLSKVMQNHSGISFHFFADDMQLYVHLSHKNISQAFDRLKSNLNDVKEWISAKMLNHDKI